MRDAWAVDTARKIGITGAVWAVEAGASMSALAQLMGHDDEATTAKHYARFTPDYLRNVVGAVQRRK